jgi:hypothetical protein
MAEVDIYDIESLIKKNGTSLIHLLRYTYIYHIDLGYTPGRDDDGLADGSTAGSF